MESGLTPMERIVLQTIEDIQDIKRGNMQHPDLAKQEEIYNSLKVEALEALRSLYRRGLITFNKTVNGIPMFGIKE